MSSHAQSDNGTGNGNGFNVSTWPKWAQVVFVIGPTAMIALFLVWQNNTRGVVQLDRIEARVEAHAATSAEVARDLAATTASLAKAAENDRAQTRTLISLQRQVCLNTAKNDDQRRECAK